MVLHFLLVEKNYMKFVKFQCSEFYRGTARPCTYTPSRPQRRGDHCDREPRPTRPRVPPSGPHTGWGLRGAGRSGTLRHLRCRERRPSMGSSWEATCGGSGPPELRKGSCLRACWRDAGKQVWAGPPLRQPSEPPSKRRDTSVEFQKAAWLRILPRPQLRARDAPTNAALTGEGASPERASGGTEHTGPGKRHRHKKRLPFPPGSVRTERPPGGGLGGERPWLPGRATPPDWFGRRARPGDVRRVPGHRPRTGTGRSPTSPAPAHPGCP